MGTFNVHTNGQYRLPYTFKEIEVELSAQPFYPIQYLKRYIFKIDFENIAFYNNIYAAQKNIALRNTTTSEIQTRLGSTLLLKIYLNFLDTYVLEANFREMSFFKQYD